MLCYDRGDLMSGTDPEDDDDVVAEGCTWGKLPTKACKNSFWSTSLSKDYCHCFTYTPSGDDYVVVRDGNGRTSQTLSLRLRAGVNGVPLMFNSYGTRVMVHARGVPASPEKFGITLSTGMGEAAPGHCSSLSHRPLQRTNLPSPSDR